MGKKKELSLRDIGEFGLIHKLEKIFTIKNTARLVKGIGDDAAVVRTDPRQALIFTTDMMMEDVHFSLKYEDFFSIGWKSLAINISDVASMGGIPKWAVISIGIPVGIPVDNVDNIARGIEALAKKYGVDIIGGDTIKSPDKLVINVALLGEAPPREILYRKGSQPGDVLFVTGKLGEAAAGLEILRNLKLEIGNSQLLVRRYLRPEPRVKEAACIVKNKLASSMIDISDGLLVSVRFLCEQSKVGAKIYLDKIPLNHRLSTINYQQALKWAVSGGEDYELLFTVPADRKKKALKLFPHGCIGEITKKSGVALLNRNGEKASMEDTGYEHFKT